MMTTTPASNEPSVVCVSPILNSANDSILFKSSRDFLLQYAEYQLCASN